MKNSLLRYNDSKNSLVSFLNEFERGIFNSFWSDPMFGLTRGWRPESLKEDDKNYIIEIEIPRVKKDEIKCEVIDDSIRVTVNNTNLKYTRLFQVSDAELNNADIQLESGVLKITIPKTEPVKPKIKQLEVKEIN